MNHTLSESQLEAMIKSAVNSSGPLPPDEKFSQLISALRELQERRKAAMDSEPVADVVAWSHPNEERKFDIRWRRHDVDPGPLYRHAQPVLEIESEPVFTLEVTRADYKGQKLGNHFGFITLDAARELKEGNYQLYTAQPAPVVPDDVLDALQKVARIRLDLNDFDGDRRGIADCLCEAEEALIEVVNRRAAMLAAAQQPPGSDSAPVPGKWIPVSERLPEAGGDMIVFTDGIVMSGVSYAKKKGFYIQALEYDDDEPVDSVTHWMSLPSAPQEVKGE